MPAPTSSRRTRSPRRASPRRDYALEPFVREMNAAAARIAREAADAAEAAEPDRPRFVAGALGPTNRTASISPDVNNAAMRNVTFEELATAYQEATEGLIEGGADILLIETIFDTLNGKAAIFGVESAFEAIWHPPPADPVGHDRRCVGSDAQRPDRRSVLDLGRACQADRRGPELRAGRPGPSSPRRRPRPGRPDPRLGLSERRPAERVRRLRRHAGVDGPRHRRTSPATDSSTSPADAAARRPPTSARSPRPSPACRRGFRRRSRSRPVSPAWR